MTAWPPGKLPQRMMHDARRMRKRRGDREEEAGAKDEGGDEGEEARASSSRAILGQLALEGGRPCSVPRDVHFGPSWRRNARYLRP